MINKDNIFSVSEINLHLKHLVESNISSLFIEGEIANFTHHNSGHIYFSLKDQNSTIRCVFFKTYNRLLQFRPKNGDKVICGGKVTVYERGGNYQITVSRMIPSGKGELQFLFEQLKDKLSEEGLFDDEHKKQLPKFPQKIGVVTSATGAAFQDIRNVIERRFPVQLLLYPSKVQGENAAAEIIKGINYFNKFTDVDLLIVGRGGGSQEDLFCFNNEKLARTIFASHIPVISAVGHEIDFTISDFVSDLRAPTPSAAAELAVPDRYEIIQYLDQIQTKMNFNIKHRTNLLKSKIEKNFLRLERQKPLERIKFLKAKLANFSQTLENSNKEISYKKQELKQLIERFELAFANSSKQNLKEKRKLLEALNDKIEFMSKSAIIQKKNDFDILHQQFIELSPQKALERGYSVLRKKNKIIKSIESLEDKDELSILFQDGEITCQINDIKKNANCSKFKE